MCDDAYAHDYVDVYVDLFVECREMAHFVGVGLGIG